jgi:glycosyltransferase involved in cell wall biosynthesis
MTSIFLGDTFSLDDPQHLGRPIANNSLARALFLCERIDKVLVVGDPAMYLSLGLPDELAHKLVLVPSPGELVKMFRSERVAAIFCSNFGKKYAQLVHFRNQNGLDCPVFGFTHTLSYQDEVGAFYRLFCAGIRASDTILCTSHAAIDVVTRLMASVRATLSFEPRGPRLVHFPLAFEAGCAPPTGGKCSSHFQVLYMGRLNWLTKADLLVIPAIVRQLPAVHNIRFIIAGANNNEGYLQTLRQACNSPIITIKTDLSDADRNQLYQESHVLLSPSDNYQETFGLTVLEAMHNGCVPVVSDFNGYRDLVKHNEDGILLETYAASIPPGLWNLQMLMPDGLYHGWWAAGVSIDPKQAAQTLYRLTMQPSVWQTMSRKSIESASQYSITATAARFTRLLDSIDRMVTDHAPAIPERNPFHIDYSEIFHNHPTTFWSDQTVQITQTGTQCLGASDPGYVPQLALLAGTITLEDIVTILGIIRHPASVTTLLAAGTQPLALSLALKNGLLYVCGPETVDHYS